MHYDVVFTLDYFLRVLAFCVFFWLSNAALYAAVFIPLSVQHTVRRSIRMKDESPEDGHVFLMTWVEISLQIASIVALATANLTAIFQIAKSNDWHWISLIFLFFCCLIYLKYIFAGFYVKPKLFEAYRQRLGGRLPPFYSRITVLRVFGFGVEVLIPGLSFLLYKCPDIEFYLPKSFPSPLN